MNRLVALCFLLALAACEWEPESHDYSEFGIETLQALMEQGELTSEQRSLRLFKRLGRVRRS